MNRMLLFAVTLLATVAAAVPSQITLTARVADAGGPLNGSHTVIVRMHGALTGGLPTWTETHMVTVTDGLMFLTLGSQTPLDATVIDGTPLFAEIQVDSTVLSPRLALVSVPYAVRAGVAENSARLGGNLPSDYALVNHVHTGFYLPLGPVLQCTGTDKVVGFSANGSVVCAPDGSGWTIGPGLSLVGSQLSVTLAGSGTAITGAHSDHLHQGTYLPIGTFTVCPMGQVMTGLNAAGNVVCANESGDITDVIAGQGLLGGGVTGSLTLAVAFGGLGAATTAARSDHTHTASCPAGYNAHASAGAPSVLCVKRVAQAGVQWYDAATSCYVSHQGGNLCTYSELRIAFSTSPVESQVVGYWIGDRVDDDWVLRVNSTFNNSNFDEKVEIVNTVVQGPGYYCCQRAQ